MIKRTHLAIAAALMLYFLPAVRYKLVFVPVVLIAALLPDIDSPSSYFGNNWFFRPFQFIAKHRGILHSMTFCFIASIAFAFFIPVLAFPFFLGYASHLFADSLTQEGIMPFWPLKNEAKWVLRTGGNREFVLFLVMLGVNFVFFLRLFA